LPALTKTGEEIRVEISLSPIGPKDESGGPYVLAIVRDVTERNRAEELLVAIVLMALWAFIIGVLMWRIARPESAPPEDIADAGVPR
jgi:hypothetical protein